MGFDINVSLDLQMCADTGRPYVWGPKFEKIYDINLANYTIPEELRRYAVGRGSIFYVYTKHFNEQDTYNVTTDMFLDEYPSWNTVMESDVYKNYYYYDNDWTEENHNGFKALLEWCARNNGASFRVSWSY